MPSVRRKLAVNALMLILSTSLSLYVAIFLYIKWAATYEKPLLPVIGGNPYVQQLYMRTNYRLLMREVSNGDMDTKDGFLASNYFETVWDFNRGVSLSKKMFIPTDMYGESKYRYRPNVRIFNGRVWDGFNYQSMVLKLTPEIEGLLRQNKVSDAVYFETDENGFKPSVYVHDNRAMTVMFLGDSFTEGLWVAPSDTFSSRFARAAAEKGLPIRPENLGVNGYSALEESWMLEHYAPQLKPVLVVVNLYPNDVYADEHAVVIGRQDVPEANYISMLGYLDRMKKFCATNGIVLAVVALPLPHQGLDNSPFQQRVRMWADQQQVLFFDPREYFSHQDMRQAHFDWDPHLTPAGHAIYADYLFENLSPVLLEKWKTLPK